MCGRIPLATCPNRIHLHRVLDKIESSSSVPLCQTAHFCCCNFSFRRHFGVILIRISIAHCIVDLSVAILASEILCPIVLPNSAEIPLGSPSHAFRLNFSSVHYRFWLGFLLSACSFRDRCNTQSVESASFRVIPLPSLSSRLNDGTAKDCSLDCYLKARCSPLIVI